MEWKDFCLKISKILSLYRIIEFSFDENRIIYKINNEIYEFTKEDLLYLEELSSKYTYENGVIYTENYYEHMLDCGDKQSNMIINLMENNIEIKDKDYKYSIKHISKELIYYLLKDYDSKNGLNRRFDTMKMRWRINELEKRDLFSLITTIIKFPMCLSISSEKIVDQDTFKSCSESFMFNMAYNYNVLIKCVDEANNVILEKKNYIRSKSLNMKEMETPKLIYNPTLIEHHFTAMSSEDPFIKFIGFYHVIEHFYEAVYNEQILNDVQDIIKNPGFSHKRKRDILKIVDVVKRKLKENKENFQGNELEALELVLKKFINVENIIMNLTQYDATLIDYYKDNIVVFSGGDKIDLNNKQDSYLLKKLAKRIYKTRNALVHNKSNEFSLNDRGIYKPFKDKERLIKEIPLIRYIAEEIIINSAAEL